MVPILYYRERLISMYSRWHRTQLEKLTSINIFLMCIKKWFTRPWLSYWKRFVWRIKPKNSVKQYEIPFAQGRQHWIPPKQRILSSLPKWWKQGLTAIDLHSKETAFLSWPLSERVKLHYSKKRKIPFQPNIGGMATLICGVDKKERYNG